MCGTGVPADSSCNYLLILFLLSLNTNHAVYIWNVLREALDYLLAQAY